MNEYRLRKKVFFLAISIFFLDFYFLLALKLGIIVVTSDGVNLFFLAIAVLNLFLAIPMILRYDNASFYPIAYVAIYLAILILVGGEVTILLVLPAILSLLIVLSSLENENKITKGLSLVFIIVFMSFLGRTFAFTLQQVPGSLTVELLSDKLVSLGSSTPITAYYGFFVSSRYIDFITGPLQFLLFFFIGSLLVENYHRIIRLLSGNGRLGSVSGSVSASYGVTAGYGTVSILGCQCESAIALFPVAALLIFNILLIPFLLLSVALLALTYLLITRYYEARRIPKMPRVFKISRNCKILGIGIIIVISEIFVVVGIFFRLQHSPIFLFGTAMEMVFNGFLLYHLVHERVPVVRISKFYSVIILVISLLVLIIWYFPGLTKDAVSDPLAFSIMSYSAIISGFLISLAYYSSTELIGSSLLEAYAVAIGIIPIILYYLSFSLQRSLWGFWSISQQAELSLVLWILMIPFMWLTTQKILILSVKTTILRNNLAVK